MMFYNSPWFFGCGSVLMFVGFAPAFKEDVTETAHVFGATGAIALGFGGLLAQGVLWPLVAFVLVTAGILGFKVTNRTWWIECIAFATIMIGLI